jgi:valyl-tRNA synthetase
MIPFVTEEIWSVLPGERTSIMTETFPTVRLDWENALAENDTALFIGVVTGIRNIRSEMMIHPGTGIQVTIVCHDADKAATLAGLAASLQSLTRTTTLTVTQNGERPKGAASYIYQDLEIFVPIAGLIDVPKELAKLEKEQAKNQEQLDKITSKLGNQQFLANAPDDVVAKERDKQEMIMAKLAKVREGMARLREIEQG